MRLSRSDIACSQEQVPLPGVPNNVMYTEECCAYRPVYSQVDDDGLKRKIYQRVGFSRYVWGSISRLVRVDVLGICPGAYNITLGASEQKPNDLVRVTSRISKYLGSYLGRQLTSL